MVLSFTNFHLTIESAQNFRTNFIIKKFHKVYLHIILSFKAQEEKKKITSMLIANIFIEYLTFSSVLF